MFKYCHCPISDFYDISKNNSLLIEVYLSRVAQAYVNQKKLDAENKLLHANTEKFIKQTQQWLKLVDNFSVSLKVLSMFL